MQNNEITDMERKLRNMGINGKIIYTNKSFIINTTLKSLNFPMNGFYVCDLYSFLTDNQSTLSFDHLFPLKDFNIINQGSRLIDFILSLFEEPGYVADGYKFILDELYKMKHDLFCCYRTHLKNALLNMIKRNFMTDKETLINRFYLDKKSILPRSSLKIISLASLEALYTLVAFSGDVEKDLAAWRQQYETILKSVNNNTFYFDETNFDYLNHQFTLIKNRVNLTVEEPIPLKMRETFSCTRDLLISLVYELYRTYFLQLEGN